MLSFCKSSPKEIFKAKPAKSIYQSNEYQAWRDAWIVAKFFESETDCCITAPYENDTTHIDAILEIDNKIYKIQCVEIKNNGPRGKPYDHLFTEHENGMIELGLMGETNPYIDVHEKIFSEITKKNTQYEKNLYVDLTLLIYLNIYFSTNTDINIDKLKKRCKNMNFEQILMRHDGDNFYIK